LLTAVVVAVLLAGACGSDDGTESAEAFCAELEEQGANEDLDLGNPEDLAAFDELTDEAPDEVKGALEQFRDVAQELEGIDEEDPDAFGDAFGAVFALFADPEFLGAVQDLGIFMADECGLEVEGIDELRELDPEDPGSLFEGFSGGDGFPEGGTADGGPDDTSDGSGTDDEPSRSSQLSDFIDENHATTAWAQAVVGKAIGSFGESADITISLDTERVELSDDDAVEACEAVADWASGTYDGEVTIAITGFSGDELAGSTDGSPCSAS
jgi:hypothetical protein